MDYLCVCSPLSSLAKPIGSSVKPVSIYQLLEQLHSLIISKLQESEKGQMNSSDNILTDNVLTFLKHSKGAFQIGFGRWKKWTECRVCSQECPVMAASVILLRYWTFFDLQKLKQSVSEEIAPGCCDRKEMYCVNAGASRGTERCCAQGKLIGKHFSNTRVQRTGVRCSGTQRADKVEMTFQAKNKIKTLGNSIWHLWALLCECLNGDHFVPKKNPEFLVGVEL